MKHLHAKYKKQTIGGALILVTVLVVSVLIVTDPLGLRHHNNEISLTPEKIERFASETAAKCTGPNSAGKQDCYKEELMALTKKYGLANGEQILLALQDKDGFARSCHVIAHYMSHEAYARSPGDFYELIDTLNVNSCGSGFLHGVLEAYTGEHPEIPVDGEFASTICGRGNDDYRKKTCVHFVGHIFLLNAYGNLEEALPLCETVRNEWKYNCYDGIFMEDHQKLILADHGMAELPVLDKAYISKLEAKCMESSGPMGQACWTEMAEIYAHAYGYKPDIIFTNCKKAQTDTYAQECYFKGVVAMSIYPGFDTEEPLTALCNFYSYDGKLYDRCNQHLLSSLIYNSPKFTSRGVTLCTNVVSNYRHLCFTHLANRLQGIIKDRTMRASVCGLLPQSYLQMCIK